MKKLLFAVAACIAMTAQAAEPFTMKIRGMVVNKPNCKELLLVKTTDDDRNGKIIMPVVDGKFGYDLTTDTREVWDIIDEQEFVGGIWTPVRIFAEPGEVEITIYPNTQREKITVTGSAPSVELARFEHLDNKWYEELGRKQQALEVRGWKPISFTYVIEPGEETGKSVIQNLNLDTPEGRALNAEYEAAMAELQGHEEDFLRQNPSEAGYVILWRLLKWRLNNPYSESKESADPLIALVPEYAAKFPDSPYRQEVENLINASANLHVGGKYIDIVLPDMNGRVTTLSELVEGRIALIDVWMTWCGPCIAGLQEAVPIYEEFKNRGFTVVGLNGDSKIEPVRARIARDKHPWTTLIDLRGEAGLFRRYGLMNSGGSRYLVDRDGTILAINPRETELRKILEEKL